jgi:hypothetical protein
MILADVLMELQDEDTTLFTKGWYVSQIQQSLEELGFDTFFEDQQQDIDIPKETMKFHIPSGCFNLKEIYVFNTDDCCNITNMQNVWWKDRFNTQGFNKGYTARNQPGIKDPYIEPYTPTAESGMYLLWYNVINGIIHLSDSCQPFDKVRVIYNGVMANIGDTPFVPRIFRQAVKDWVSEKAYRYMMNRDPRRFTPLWKNINIVLNAPYNGSWDVAKQRAAALDSKMKSDLKEYLSSMNS